MNRPVSAEPVSSAAYPDASQGRDRRGPPLGRYFTRDVLCREPRRPGPAGSGKCGSDLYTRMKSDVAQPAWLALWGVSINFDELANRTVLDPAILGSFEKLFGVQPYPVDSNLAQAGIEHTYGYLFSNLKTSFGFKRARWIRPTLDRGFGLPDGTLAPIPRAGTLFSNVSYFMGHIAFRNEAAPLAVLEAAKARAAPAVVTFPYSSLSATRLEETVTVPGTHPRTVKLRTDLVPFLQPVTGDTNTHVLVYSIDDPSNGGVKLITAFPVERSFVNRTLDPKGLGDNQPVITRYNGYVEGLTGSKLAGKRRILPPPTSRP